MYKEFHFNDFGFSLAESKVSLSYKVDEKYEFVEEFILPNSPRKLTEQQEQALQYVLKYWHLAVGISYYKAFLPESIVLDSYAINSQEAEFFERFYINGLGEFAVRNNLHFFEKIKFPFQQGLKREPIDLHFNEEVLLPIGGGKDSCVTAELLRDLGIKTTAIACGEPKPIADVIAKSGMDKIIIKRKIAPELLRLNESGEVYNGHVPITGILAFMLWAVSIIYNKKYVVMSCERSASSGNMVYDGVKINHQYSKSYDFENDFYALTQKITPQFRYFSILRPISEIHIAKLFAQKCSKYFEVFTSCNKAFKLDEEKRLNHWCGDCDKCRFVFLILAPFMDRDKLIAIVGKNPLDDENQIKGYEELLGLTGYKPFECVGEFAESKWALTQLANKSEWQNDCVIKALANKIQNDDHNLFVPSGQHIIPERFSNVMAEFRK